MALPGARRPERFKPRIGGICRVSGAGVVYVFSSLLKEDKGCFESAFCSPRRTTNGLSRQRGVHQQEQVVNDLIRKACEIGYARTKLIKAEQGGFSDQSAAEVLAMINEETRKNRDL